jgi:dTDP-4-dehydrorhamnose 3,5-epimerase
MKIIETGLDGLVLLSPKIFLDERGFFYESWRLNDYKKYGIQENFVQDNVSASKKNVLRGMHYQENQGQLVTVFQGKIFDVAIDNRPRSKTYKRYFSVILSSEEGRQLYMPPGFAHGFCVLSDVAYVHYKCTRYYDEKKEGGIIWDDPEVGILWPISNPIISKKDKKLKKVSEIYV